LEIKGIEDSVTIAEEYIRLAFQTKMNPSTQYIEVYEGMYVNMKHNENYKNLTACSLIRHKVC